MLGAEVMQHAKAAVPVVGHQSAQQMAQLDVAALHEKAMVIFAPHQDSKLNQAEAR